MSTIYKPICKPGPQPFWFNDWFVRLRAKGKGYHVSEPHNGVPIKAWTKGVTVEASAKKQLRHVASMLRLTSISVAA